jgi:hypothetical protein
VEEKMAGITTYVATRLKLIEEELQRLRKHLERPKKKKATKIEGLWKGVSISEEDIEEAKRSLFKGARELNE